MVQDVHGLGEEEEGAEPSGTLCAHVKSSYVVSMREMDVMHIKDFTFLHGKFDTNEAVCSFFMLQ
jgi:cleavage and polyadenylation specificity factor subunit 1